MACVITLCSSRIAIASSNPTTNEVVVFLNCGSLNSIDYHSKYIFFRLHYMLYSFSALSPTSTQTSVYSTKPRSRTFCKVKSSSGFTTIPVFSVICYQCLSFIPSFLTDTAIGTYGINCSTFFFIVSAICKI